MEFLLQFFLKDIAVYGVHQDIPQYISLHIGQLSIGCRRHIAPLQLMRHHLNQFSHVNFTFIDTVLIFFFHFPTPVGVTHPKHFSVIKVVEGRCPYLISQITLSFVFLLSRLHSSKKHSARLARLFNESHTGSLPIFFNYKSSLSICQYFFVRFLTFLYIPPSPKPLNGCHTYARGFRHLYITK